MVMKSVFLGVTVASISLGTLVTDAASKEVHFKSKYSGSGTSAFPDPNHDGIRAGTGVLGCISNLGRCTAPAVGEARYTGPATCPNGNQGVGLELIPGTGHGFTRFEKGDMVFSELVGEIVMLSPTVCRTRGPDHGDHRPARRLSMLSACWRRTPPGGGPWWRVQMTRAQRCRLARLRWNRPVKRSRQTSRSVTGCGRDTGPGPSYEEILP